MLIYGPLILVVILIIGSVLLIILIVSVSFYVLFEIVMFLVSNVRLLTIIVFPFITLVIVILFKPSF